MEIESEYFAYRDSDLSQIFKLNVSTSENIVNNINVVTVKVS